MWNTITNLVVYHLRRTKLYQIIYNKGCFIIYACRGIFVGEPQFLCKNISDGVSILGLILIRFN